MPQTRRPLSSSRRWTAPQLPILERGSEARALRDAIESARAGSGRLVVIVGEAGIGKSTLIREAVACARAAGLRVIQATGNELERQYADGVAVRLFEPLVRERPVGPAMANPFAESTAPAQPSRSGLFAGPAAHAARLFRQPEDSSREAGDPFAMVHGLYWLALNAAEREPLMIAVDDAQWADDGSLRFLHYLAQRVREAPIAVVIAFRSGEGATLEELGGLFQADRGAVHLNPRPLSEAAVGELLEASGAKATDEALPVACRQATAGNPFLVTELLWELWRKRSSDGEAGQAGGQGSGATPDELLDLVPERVMRFVEARFRGLDPGAQRLAEMVAVLGEEATLRRAATLARIGDDEAVGHARHLSRAAILKPDGPLEFIHPVVRSAVYASIPSVARRQAHGQAARLIHEAGAPIGVVVGQLLASEPAGDPWVVTALLEGAKEAAGRGEPRVAAGHLRRALVEPPLERQRLEVVRGLARAEGATGSPAAISLYREAIGLTRNERTRAAILLELGNALVATANLQAAADAFWQGLKVLGNRDDPLAAPLEAGLAASAWLGMTHGAEAEAIAARAIEDRTLGSGRRELAMSIAFQRSISGTASAQQMLPLVRRALAEAPIETLVTEGQMIELATGVLFSTDDLPFEIELLSRAIAAVQEAGSFAKVGLYSAARSWPNYFTGRLSDAIADTEAGLRAAEIGWEAFYPAARGIQAMAQIERADLAAAQRLLSIEPDPWGQRADWVVVLIARGRLFLALGEPAKAAAELRAAGEFASRVGYRNPGPPAWRQWLAVALARRNERPEARRVAAEALEIARAWGARWPLGAALRVAGLAEGGTRGLELLRQAVAQLEGSCARLEQARALVDLGAASRRQGQLIEAREFLSRGLDLAHRLGAQALLVRSRDELRAAGVRPRRFARTGLESLTPSESRVAQLAVDGRTNREIAQALFVTPKAVEYHLANVYRKLEIGSRHELGSALGAVSHPLPVSTA